MRTTATMALVLGIVFCGIGVQSQQAGGSANAPVQTLADGSRMIQIIGEPYSATTEVESVRTLADGTRVTRKMMTLKTYRDSQGRIREERYVQMGRKSKHPPA